MAHAGSLSWLDELACPAFWRRASQGAITDEPLATLAMALTSSPAHADRFRDALP